MHTRETSARGGTAPKRFKDSNADKTRKELSQRRDSNLRISKRSHLARTAAICAFVGGGVRVDGSGGHVADAGICHH